MPIQKSAQIPIKILEILKELQNKGTKKIRSTKLMGLCIYHGITIGSLYYHLNKLVDKGFVQRTVIKTNEIYYSLSNFDFDFKISYIQEQEMDNIMSDYDTFKKHVLKWDRKQNEPFTLNELQSYIRSVIHKGITASSFNTYLKKMVDENYIDKMGYVDIKSKICGGGNFVYRLCVDAQQKPSLTPRYPLIKDLYELIILKTIFGVKDKTISWNSLKRKLESKCGPIKENDKLRKALNNLLAKKQLIRVTDDVSGVYYSLSSLYDFETALREFKFSGRYQRQDEKILA